jgi:hypothetical protein
MPRRAFLACALFGQLPFHRMRKVLLCPPDYFDVVDQKNPYMSRESAVIVETSESGKAGGTCFCMKTFLP